MSAPTKNKKIDQVTSDKMIHQVIYLSPLFLSISVLLFTLGAAESFIATLGPSLALVLSWGSFALSLAIFNIGYRGQLEILRSFAGRCLMTVGLIAFYLAVYFEPQFIQGWILLISPLSLWLTQTPADQWFLYGSLYTLVVITFGMRAIKRFWGNRYHLWRTLSLIFFQLCFAFLIPGLLKRAQLPDFYFTYFWPLKPDYFLPFDYIINQKTGVVSAELNGLSVGRAMLLWGIMMSFIATPILTYLYGKRWYCSWVCGCGALAETFGDTWRRMSPKTHSAWRFERYSVHLILALTILTTILLWVNEFTGRAILGSDGSQWFWGGYGLWITMIFSGVIGVGFYPLLGPRVWCRFACPQAAILGILQRYLSRFQISTNGGQCVSCGECSSHCEMGIDVRAYAQEQQVIVRASCVGCGVCATVCPRGVLRLENKNSQSLTP